MTCFVSLTFFVLNAFPKLRVCFGLRTLAVMGLSELERGGWLVPPPNNGVHMWSWSLAFNYQSCRCFTESIFRVGARRASPLLASNSVVSSCEHTSQVNTCDYSLAASSQCEPVVVRGTEQDEVNGQPHACAEEHEQIKYGTKLEWAIFRIHNIDFSYIKIGVLCEWEKLTQLRATKVATAMWVYERRWQSPKSHKQFWRRCRASTIRHWWKLDSKVLELCHLPT